MPVKKIGNCLSAPVTNPMAFASKCEIQGRASRRRLLSACSKLSTPRNLAVWDLDCRSAGRLLKRITDDCGRALTCHVALSSASLYLLIRPPHREWSLASNPQSGDAILCNDRSWPILLQKSFWGGKRKFLELLMR